MFRTWRHFASIAHIPSLKEFMKQENGHLQVTEARSESAQIKGLKYFVETYGCQMNSNDSAIVASVLESAGLLVASSVEQADVVLLNTCAIRDHAEQKIWQRLYEFRALRRKGEAHTVAVLGCMAERLKEKLLTTDRLADIVAGPDSYRSLPRLLEAVRLTGNTAMDVQLSQDETYADISPVRQDPTGLTASISIMRGCNNMCSFCVVPFTRGRERSRQFSTVLEEVRKLSENGVREITLLGQNVNSYLDESTEGKYTHENTPGFKEMYRLRDRPGARFADLIAAAAESAPGVRFRFTSPHPKDFPAALIQVIKTHPNVCKQVHLPVQSGSTKVLEAMRRNYTREAYLSLLHRLRDEIPGVAVSTDVIAGFCGETEEDHRETLRLMEEARYEQAFTFAYSLRPRTHAANNYPDDVPQEVKLRRLQEIIDCQRRILKEINELEVGKTHIVLVENNTKRSPTQLTGKTDTGKRVIFELLEGDPESLKGTYVTVQVTSVSTQTLFASLLKKLS